MKLWFKDGQVQLGHIYSFVYNSAYSHKLSLDGYYFITIIFLLSHSEPAIKKQNSCFCSQFIMTFLVKIWKALNVKWQIIPILYDNVGTEQLSLLASEYYGASNGFYEKSVLKQDSFSWSCWQIVAARLK